MYLEIYVSNPQNERLYQIIHIDNSGGCHAVFTNELYGSDGYIAGFIIYVNGANGYICVLINNDHCL